MSNKFKTQKAFFIKGWYIYALWKLGLAEEADVHPAMWTKINIHEIENKITVEARRASAEIMGTIEKEMYWGDGSLEREPEKKK